LLLLLLLQSLSLLLLLLNKHYILYILLLDEGVAACAWRLGNMLTLAHFVALAFVKSLPRNGAYSQQQRQNLKHSQKWNLINNDGHLKSSHSGGEASSVSTTSQQQI